MALGRLAGLISTMPAWVTFIVKQDELDLTPPGGGEWKLPSQNELVAAHDKSVREVAWCRRRHGTSRCATCSITWHIIAAN